MHRHTCFDLNASFFIKEFNHYFFIYCFIYANNIITFLKFQNSINLNGK